MTAFKPGQRWVWLDGSFFTIKSVDMYFVEAIYDDDPAKPATHYVQALLNDAEDGNIYLYTFIDEVIDAAT